MDTKPMLIELFILSFKACPLEDKVTMHNLYVHANCDNERYIYENNDDFFDNVLEYPTSVVVKAIFKGEYDYEDKYVWMDYNGYLQSASTTDEMPFFEPFTMADWFLNHWDTIKGIENMGRFYEICEQM